MIRVCVYLDGQCHGCLGPVVEEEAAHVEGRHCVDGQVRRHHRVGDCPAHVDAHVTGDERHEDVDEIEHD